MRFDIYGRFLIEVLREDERWVVYRIDQGRRLALHDLMVPPDIPPAEIPRWLDDLLHESAVTGKTIRLLE